MICDSNCLLLPFAFTFVFALNAKNEENKQIEWQTAEETKTVQNSNKYIQIHTISQLKERKKARNWHACCCCFQFKRFHCCCCCSLNFHWLLGELLSVCLSVHTSFCYTYTWARKKEQINKRESVFSTLYLSLWYVRARYSICSVK